MQIQACFQNKPSCCLIISSCKQIVCLPSRCSQTFRWWTSLCVSCRGRWRPTCRPSTSSWDKTTTSASCPPSSTRCWRAWWQSSTLHSSSHREHRYTHAHTHTHFTCLYTLTLTLWANTALWKHLSLSGCFLFKLSKIKLELVYLTSRILQNTSEYNPYVKCFYT